jgi:sugar phosphate isomerase/epimerase
MNTVSFMSANFVARQLGYHMTEGWMQGDTATNDYFRPIETFEERFDAMLAEVKAMGFEAIDIWIAHLNPGWATDEHISIARKLLAERGLRVASLAGFYGDTPEEAEAYCRLAIALETDIIGGNIPLMNSDRPALDDILSVYGVRLGLENHPEKSAAELMGRIGDSPSVGICADTGWFGTHGYPAPQALTELAPVLVHVHLKDVRAAGGHETCRFGEGVVDVEGCVNALLAAGYEGGLSIEHEPEHHDPTADVVASKVMLEGWLNRGTAP